MLIVTVSGAKKKIIVGLIVIILLVVGVWIVPRVSRGLDSDKPAISTIGEKGAPPLLERIINRLRVYYHYR